MRPCLFHSNRFPNLRGQVSARSMRIDPLSRYRVVLYCASLVYHHTDHLLGATGSALVS